MSAGDPAHRSAAAGSRTTPTFRDPGGRSARGRLRPGRGRPDHRRRPGLGSDLDVVAGRTAAGRPRGTARGVHRAGGDRDREQPGARRAHPARRGAGGAAARGDPGRGRRAAGGCVRSGERGGRSPCFPRTPRLSRATRTTARVTALERLDDRGRLRLRREALRARRHRVRADLRDAAGPGGIEYYAEAPGGCGRGRPRDGLALVGGSADHRRRPALGRAGRRLDERAAPAPRHRAAPGRSSPSSWRRRSRTPRP
mgnify:CR=1 FL=1